MGRIHVKALVLGGEAIFRLSRRSVTPDGLFESPFARAF